nr:MAG TPA: hypothetical protein [Caudoviricetes sp.]
MTSRRRVMELAFGESKIFLQKIKAQSGGGFAFFF